MDLQGLNHVIAEHNRLSSITQPSKQEVRRMDFLMSAAAAIKAGATLADLEQRNLNAYELKNGLDVTRFNSDGLTPEQRDEAKGWAAFLKHSPKAGRGVSFRDMTEGAAAAISRIGTYTGLGFFVPTGFQDQLFASLAAHDFLFDEESVTLIKTANGAPLPVPVASDTENVATLVNSEPAPNTSTDISSTSHVTLGAYSFSSPRFVISIEADQDLQGSLSTISLAKRFFTDRLARGVGKYLVNGTGSAQPTGLLQGLLNIGAPVVTAAGSAINDGSGATGANSLGTSDFAAAFGDLDASYLASDKVAWAMNLKTLGTLMNVLDKYGRPIIDFVGGARYILGVPIKICPSLPNIGPSNTPVVLGDFSYFATRLVFDENSGITVFRESPGLVENGNVALKLFARADSNILWNDAGGKAPFVSIQNHS